MENKIMRAALAGIIATAVMTAVGVMAPFMGLPKMNPAEMLSGMLGVSLALGYLMHFMIGIIFAATYVYWFNGITRIRSKFWKGMLFGFAVFIFAQIMLGIMGTILPMPDMEGNMFMMLIGSLTGHLVFGVFVAWMVPMKAPGVTHDAKIAGQH